MPNTQAAVERALRRKAELKYSQALRRITRELQSRIDGLSDPLLIISELRRAAESKGFLELCHLAAERMATVVTVGEKTNWRQAASASTKGKAVYSALRKGTAPDTAIGQAIREIIERNAELIRTVPQETARQLSQMAREAQFKGMRPAELAELIKQKAPHLNNSQARLIARTESAKASTALQQVRAESLNLQWYIWRTASDGERVRDSHRVMEGVLCRWSEPPCPEQIAKEKGKHKGRVYGSYHPGGIFNCRCIALPVIALEDISFPAKVHVSGQIILIPSLPAFKERFGLPNDQERQKEVISVPKKTGTPESAQPIAGEDTPVIAPLPRQKLVDELAACDGVTVVHAAPSQTLSVVCGGHNILLTGKATVLIVQEGGR